MTIKSSFALLFNTKAKVPKLISIIKNQPDPLKERLFTDDQGEYVPKSVRNHMLLATENDSDKYDIKGIFTTHPKPSFPTKDLGRGTITDPDSLTNQYLAFPEKNYSVHKSNVIEFTNSCAETYKRDNISDLENAIERENSPSEILTIGEKKFSPDFWSDQAKRATEIEKKSSKFQLLPQ